MNDPIVSGRSVTKSFGATQALRGATIDINRGEVVAIMGPSGSGKSTLLHCLAGILVPDAGQVWFDGRRIDTLGEHQRTELRRKHFGFVFQFGQLVPELTAIENVALPLMLARSPRKQALAAALPWFSRLKLDRLQDRRPGELSGGETQRVALARALAPAPEVVFADEPTGALDSLAGELVMDLLVDSARQAGATVVLVTHEARVAAYADREVIVRDGQVSAAVGA